MPATVGQAPPEDRARALPDGPSAAPDPARERFLLTLWTDEPTLAGEAARAGVDRIGLDLERRGKQARQAGLGTWISTHRLERLPALRDAVAGAQLFARVNPPSPESPAEVEHLLAEGVQVLMLPMFRRAEEVERFCATVAGRALVVPLLETLEAVEEVQALASVAGVHELHVGINDLALSLGARNRFEVLDGEPLRRIAADAHAAGLRLGIGGIGRLGDPRLPIPADLVYAQYARLGASAALLSRAFTDGACAVDRLGAELQRSRARLARWSTASVAELEHARLAFRAAVGEAASW